MDLEDGSSALPGGEAMLEVLTRLQKYQDALCTQLEVSTKSACHACGGPLGLHVYD